MPDASADATLDALVAAGFGATGQTCMALSTAVFVGGSLPWYNVLLLFNRMPYILFMRGLHFAHINLPSFPLLAL